EVAGRHAQTTSLSHVGDARYDITAQVVRLADDWWVIDAGVLAFQEDKPPNGITLGSWLRGSVSIGIDPFFYFESLARAPGAPALIYDWKVFRIEEQAAPFIEVRPGYWERDPARFGWKEIAKTDAWKSYGQDLGNSFTEAPSGLWVPNPGEAGRKA